MDKRKLIGLIVIVAVLLIVGSVYWATNQIPSSKPTPTMRSVVNFDPKNPDFIMATVSAVNGNNLVVSNGPSQYTAMISKSTTLLKQVQTKTSVELSAASISDFKTGQTVIVFFSNAAQNNTYKADKIQILSQ